MKQNKQLLSVSQALTEFERAKLGEQELNTYVKFISSNLKKLLFEKALELTEDNPFTLEVFPQRSYEDEYATTYVFTGFVTIHK